MKKTINIEHEMIRMNKAVITARELLAVQQYDRLEIAKATNVLERSGMTGTFKGGQELKNKTKYFEETNAQFPAEKVFHISQIEKIANRYGLRFLPAEKYRGSVPDELGAVLEKHERDYHFKLRPEKTFIMAPASSFNLEPNPDDPLAFHQINSEYYFLMYKWGNDLSWFRRVQVFFDTPHTLLLVLPVIYFFGLLIPENHGRQPFWAACAAFVLFIYLIAVSIPKTKFDSPLED